MSHMSIGFDNEIVEHLDSFGIDKLQMILHDHGLHKVLVDQLATNLPLLAIRHEEHMVTSADNAITHMRVGSMVVQARFLVEEISHKIRRSQNYGRGRSHLEGKDAAILLGPFAKSFPLVSCDIHVLEIEY